MLSSVIKWIPASRYFKLIFKIPPIILFFIASMIFYPDECAGQNRRENNHLDTTKLKLFMDCYDCDFVYFRRNLPYVDFVRDPKLSDVHLLVTERRTASGGREYGMNFIGSGKYDDLEYKLVTNTTQSDTRIEIWEKLIKTTRMGLMPFLNRTSEMNNFIILYQRDSLDLEIERESYDPWNFWVFRIRLGTDVELEESQNEYSAMGSFRMDRITESIKFRSDIMYYRNVESFQDASEKIESVRELIDSDMELVYSLGPRWSAGIFNEIRSSTYENMDFSNKIGPAIEYNIFPWDESDRRIFSLGYHIESHYFNYSDTTIYNRIKEWRASQSLRLTLIMRQPWGEVETRLEGAHYFHDFSFNSITLDSEVSVNITRGLSLFFEIQGGLVHDQLYLPAGEITREELLLRQRQLKTSYEISGEFGIVFTFGSIYNNIVNQRL